MGCWTAALVSVYAIAAGAGDCPYTVDEVIAGYHQNFARFRTLRVQMRLAERHGANWIKHWQMEADAWEDQSRQPGISAEERARLLAQAEERRKVARHPHIALPHYTLQDFWTDGSSFQQRVPLAAAGWATPALEGDFLAPPGVMHWTFPDVPPSGDNLATVYHDVQIVSYAPEVGFRAWKGRANSARPGTGWSSGGSHGGLTMFPPLGRPPAEWKAMVHIIDEFFALPAEEMRMAGTAELHGRKLCVIEHVKEIGYQSWLQPHEIDKYAGKIQRFNVVRAWIDPAQGCLPLRIEWDSYLAQGGVPLEVEKTIRGPRPLWRVLEEIRVSQVDGGGFYPMSGVLRTYGRDVSSDQMPLTVSDILEGRATSWPPAALTEEKSWQVLKLEANVDIPEGFFALPFPQNTLYYDAAQGRGLVTGSAQKYLDGAIGPPGEPIPVESGPQPPRRRWWLAACVALVVLAGVALVVRARLKSRATKAPATEGK